MRSWFTVFLLFCCLPAWAMPPDELVYNLKMSVVKIFVVDQFGNQGVGSGIVVAEDHVATNCHVVANARGVHVIKFGESHIPVALKADWKHDLCLLKFEKLGMTPVKLTSSKKLHYSQSVFTIGFPNGVMVPLTSFGEIEALYPMDGGNIIRASANFRMGSSGGPIFDETGALIGLTTLKSPGRDAYYYSIPSDWIAPLLLKDEVRIASQKEPPFWDVPEEKRPYFMRVVQPLKEENWAELESISRTWIEKQPESAEAWYLLGLAEQKQGKLNVAVYHFEKSLNMNSHHIEARIGLDQIKSRFASK